MVRLSLSAAVLLASAGQSAAFMAGITPSATLRPILRAATSQTPISMAAQPEALSRREARPRSTRGSPRPGTCSTHELQTAS
jgi:hypothetical protein